MSSKAPVWRYGGPIGFHLPEVAVIPNGVGGMFGVEEEASRMPELPATPFLIIRWAYQLERGSWIDLYWPWRRFWVWNW